MTTRNLWLLWHETTTKNVTTPPRALGLFAPHPTKAFSLFSPTVYIPGQRESLRKLSNTQYEDNHRASFVAKELIQD